MNNFSVQSLTLTIMIAMVYAAHLGHHTTTHPPHNILKIIRHLAEEMLKNGTWEQQVPNPTGENGIKCVTEFFCNAEKSLKQLLKEKLGVEAKNQTIKLMRQLDKFNENITNCELDKNRTYRAKDLLCDIEDCARRRGKKN